ncbi:hypothetical protein ABEB36_001796 [Hypothenemus hampei]|uniref:Uncharacterized protein n=1 Tax=Hypothenemus hampei TaxID=57062 RepID=A0ABD1FID9_HYPHA
MRHVVSEETKEPEEESSTVSVNFTSDAPQLNPELKSALLKALSDLENEDDDLEESEEEKVVERARASAITIVTHDLNSNSNNSHPEDDIIKENAQFVLFQKSEPIQGTSITSLETTPIDPVKDAEHIITSASNSFIMDVTSRRNEVRSLTEDSKEIDQKRAGVNINAISNEESTKPSKITVVEKFSFGKAANVKPSDTKTTLTENQDLEITTAGNIIPEISTEESEAKVEQVQFFSAPLVAAFTVHQDELGQPKKVEPIYKNEPKTETSTPSSTSLFSTPQKQEELLQKFQSQQQSFIARNSFNQAISQNFNQFDPVFTEPDRSIVTKLATIDPSQLLAQNSPQPLLSKFTPNEAIQSPINFVQPNLVVPELKFNTKSNDVSLVQSLSFDPLVEAGKLPDNAKILPTKEPTGFHSFVKFPKFREPVRQNLVQTNNFANPATNFLHNQNNQPNRFVKQDAFQSFQNNIPPSQFPNQNRLLRQEQGTGNLGVVSIVPAQQPFPPKHEFEYFPDNNRFLRANIDFGLQPPQPNRFFNSQNTFLGPQNSNRFFRSNLEGVNFGFGQRLVGAQGSTNNNNRFLRSNQEGSLSRNRNSFGQGSVYQTYKYSSPFGFPNINIPTH